MANNKQRTRIKTRDDSLIIYELGFKTKIEKISLVKSRPALDSWAERIALVILGAALTEEVIDRYVKGESGKTARAGGENAGIAEKNIAPVDEAAADLRAALKSKDSKKIQEAIKKHPNIGEYMLPGAKNFQAAERLR